MVRIDKDQDAIHVFCYNDSGRVAGCLRVFWKDHDKDSGIVSLLEENQKNCIRKCTIEGAATRIFDYEKFC